MEKNLHCMEMNKQKRSQTIHFGEHREKTKFKGKLLPVSSTWVGQRIRKDWRQKPKLIWKKIHEVPELVAKVDRMQIQVPDRSLQKIFIPFVVIAHIFKDDVSTIEKLIDYTLQSRPAIKDLMKALKISAQAQKSIHRKQAFLKQALLRLLVHGENNVTQKQCPPGMIYNPASKRCVSANSKLVQTIQPNNKSKVWYPAYTKNTSRFTRRQSTTNSNISLSSNTESNTNLKFLTKNQIIHQLNNNWYKYQ